jgi:GntR family transcriptional regulator
VRNIVSDTYSQELSNMIWSADNRREDLVQRVTKALREQILSGQLSPGMKLVPEAEFSKTLGISRPSLREALRVLAREGLINVRHGVGTFVSDNVKPMINSLELMRSMTDLIRSAGGEPRTRDLSIDLIEPPDDVAEQMELKAGQLVGRIYRVRLRDDRPFVVAKEYVVLDGERRSFETLKLFDGGSLYGFLRERMDMAISHSNLRMSAVAAEPAMAQVLGLPRHAPLLLMRETHYGFGGRPCLYSVNYHNTAIVEFVSNRAGLVT